MNDPASGKRVVPGDDAGKAVQYYKKEFWTNENLNYSRPHLRMEKAARIIDTLAQGKERTLLDIGCGPATLMRLLPPNIKYYGIDIAIHDPAPNLIESDLLENPIRFDDKRFDIVLAQGFFEYVGEFQSKKLSEIPRLLNPDGTFIASYVNFRHRHKDVYWPYNNVQSFDSFRESLTRNFKVDRFFPSSYNWNHHAPRRKLLRTINLHLDFNIPLIGPMLAVEYFFVCSLHLPKSQESRHPRPHHRGRKPCLPVRASPFPDMRRCAVRRRKAKAPAPDRSLQRLSDRHRASARDSW